MRKTTIFVEGWTEQVWVREYLLKWHGYEEAWVECFALFNERGMYSVPYNHQPINPLYYYHIVNVGGDTRVNNALVKEMPRLRNEGFHRIVGLRDMLSDVYRDLVNSHKVDDEVVERIRREQWEVLKMFFGDKTSDIHLCYAIMEIESWVLGLSEFFELIDEGLTLDFIKTELNLDLKNTDPETTIFNPASTLSKVFNLAGKPYGKKQGEIDSIVSLLSKQDYEAFLAKEQCMSFNVFHNAIHNE